MNRESDLRDWRLNRLTIRILLSLQLSLLRFLDQSIKLIQAGHNVPLSEDLLKVHAHARTQPICELLVEMSQAIGYLFGRGGKA
jgi:hypothetical protein